MNLSDDPNLALQGVLWRSRGAWLVLRDASVQERDDRGQVTTRRLDGDAVVHRGNVSFVQVLP